LDRMEETRNLQRILVETPLGTSRMDNTKMYITVTVCDVLRWMELSEDGVQRRVLFLAV